MNHENPEKVLRNIKEAIQSAMFISGDAKDDHENDTDRLAYEYFRGKKALKKHLKSYRYSKGIYSKPLLFLTNTLHIYAEHRNTKKNVKMVGKCL